MKNAYPIMFGKIIMTLFTIALSLTEMCLGSTKAPEMLSHNQSQEKVSERIVSITERLKATDPASLALPLDETLKILDEMVKCNGLGHWLLMHQGLNGFWTAEAILRNGGEEPSDIARWIANSAPIFCATRERFEIFKKALQKRINAGDKIFISVPCGTMEELLTLDAHDKQNVRFIGIDLDSLADSWIKEASTRYSKTSSCHKESHQGDAFALSRFVKDADVLVSNGLNFYIKDDAEVIKLYKAFADALKTGGILITSHLALPSQAKPYDIEAAKKQLAIVRDICEMRWQIFRSEDLVKEQLAEAGFEVQEVIGDTQNMFPTYICKKVR